MVGSAMAVGWAMTMLTVVKSAVVGQQPSLSLSSPCNITKGTR